MILSYTVPSISFTYIHLLDPRNGMVLQSNLSMCIIVLRILFVFCFSLFSVFYSIVFGIIAFSLTRSDIPGGPN